MASYDNRAACVGRLCAHAPESKERKMKTRITLAVLAMLVAALAQPPGPHPGGPPRLDAIKAYLNLTDAQLQGIGDLKSKEHDAIAPLAQAAGDKEKALHDALDGGSTDAAALGALLMQVRDLHKQIDQVRAATQAQERALLTPDQTAKLGALADAARLLPAVAQASELGLIDAPHPGMGHEPGIPGGGPAPAMRMRRPGQ